MFEAAYTPHSQNPIDRQKIVIGHPRVGRGGSESRVMWLIEALKRDCDVTVVTTSGWNLEELNAHYGTQIQEHEIKVRIAPIPIWARRLDAAALRGACFQRFARQVAAEYDIRLSAYNPTDWGLPAVHFIADFSWHQNYSGLLDPPGPGFLYRNTMLRRIYLRVAAAHGRPSGRNVLRDDLLVANSNWSAALMKQVCGVECPMVVYPAVGTAFSDIPWEDREQAFAMIGRIAPEKQIERAIAILEGVRERGHAVRLHLCGEISHDLYGRQIARICKKRADWIILEGRVSGARKRWILSHCRYGIQTRAAEPFGISVAEMVKAGAIVFAPDNGGQTEILQNSHLLFATKADAIQKIDAVLSDAALQVELRRHLLEQSQLFGSEQFLQQAQMRVLPEARLRAHSNSYKKRLKVVIGHPALGRGGSEAAVMWLLEALKEDYELTLVTTGGWDLDSLNRYYGTHVRKIDVTVRLAAIPKLASRLRASALRGACFQRYARSIAGEYDVRISAYNPTDWGMPALHFIQDFSWHRELREKLDPPTPGLIYKDSFARRFYLWSASKLGKPSTRNLLTDDRSLANSEWTRRLATDTCGAKDTEVLYAPVWTNFSVVPWQDKENAFVMIGRIAPEKRIECCISILDALRLRGHNLKLHLCGSFGSDLYSRQILQLCRERADWISVEGFVDGDKKTEILTKCRFGIQGRKAEPFGISVAEMVKAGAIVFASNEGGQAEILNDQMLLYSDEEEAVRKIDTVLLSGSLQQRLLNHLQSRAPLFGTEDFVRSARECLDKYVQSYV